MAGPDGVQGGGVSPSYGATVGGQDFRVCASNEACTAPPVADWGSRPAGDDYRTAWDAVAGQLGTQNPIAIRTEIERQIIAAQGLDGIRNAGPAAAAAEPTPAGANAEGIGAFFEGALAGDYSDNNSWSKIGGQVAMGFVPIAGQIADIRDISAAAGQIWRGEAGGWGNLGLAAIGIVPGIGDGIKGALRGGAKAADEVAEAVAAGAARGTGDVPAGAPGRVDEAAAATRATQVAGRVGLNEARWTLDARGRPTEASATLRELHDGTKRSNAELKAQKDVKQFGRAGDQGGHIVGHRFMPGQGLKNLFPQAGDFNTGAYYRMEGEWADWIKAGAEVKLDVKFGDFDARGRPGTVDVSYTVVDKSGREVFQRDARFANEPGQRFNRLSASEIGAMVNR